ALCSSLFPYTTLFRSWLRPHGILRGGRGVVPRFRVARKSPAEGCNRERRGWFGSCTGFRSLRVEPGSCRDRSFPENDRRRRTSRSEEHTSELQSLAYL